MLNDNLSQKLTNSVSAVTKSAVPVRLTKVQFRCRRDDRAPLPFSGRCFEGDNKRSNSPFKVRFPRTVRNFYVIIVGRARSAIIPRHGMSPYLLQHFRYIYACILSKRLRQTAAHKKERPFKHRGRGFVQKG